MTRAQLAKLKQQQKRALKRRKRRPPEVRAVHMTKKPGFGGLEVQPILVTW